MADLQVGDIYHPGNHVLALRPFGEQIEVVQTCSLRHDGGVVGGETKPVTHQVRVNRGWCPRGDDCTYCPMNDQTFTEAAQAYDLKFG